MCSGPVVEERPLVLDDGPRHLQQRVAPLLDGLHQPVGRLEFLAQLFLHLLVEVLVLDEIDGALADANLRHPLVREADRVLVVVGALDDRCPA